ncbi:hypothetical protein BK816_00815 [Boudabousia tangfeifanii]|uniref:Uncharacterized protein n=2 Tax=Boudabousia tangfeifanii TaxID=1912795 RepID=A0A1D9MI85_9ACTO|nr:hypothetical protein BK816_00815 [Boudabousia tangfeifanii]
MDRAKVAVLLLLGFWLLMFAPLATAVFDTPSVLRTILFVVANIAYLGVVWFFAKKMKVFENE